MRWQTVTDFFVLALTFYALLRWSQGARAARFVLSAVGFHLSALLADRLGLIITSWVLEVASALSILLVVIVFQPELRSAFMQINLSWISRPLSFRDRDRSQNLAVTKTAFKLAQDGLGGLFVLPVRDAVDELVQGGENIHSDLSPALLESVFQKSSPLHDGAVVIDNGRIERAGAILPLTHGDNMPAEFGTRHRAALGLVERCDAIVVVVSEERGEVSVMHRRSFQRMPEPEQLATVLEEHLRLSEEDNRTPLLRRLLFSHGKLKALAICLAVLVWAVSVLAPSVTIRTLTVPIEFGNVPTGTVVASQSADLVAVQLRGNSWILDTLTPNSLTARFDLKDLSLGQHSLVFDARSLDLPPGIEVAQATPRQIRVGLDRSPPPDQSK